ncbi:hypothetical protein DRQ33_07675 [bacterium]|nr:MAG: hypothetical protein DRQ33_07675 [bacterium]
MNIKCPRCGSSLKRVEYEGIYILKCPRDHGCWVNRNELGEIVRRKEKKMPGEYFEEVEKNVTPQTVETKVLTKDIRCPICNAECDKINYSYSSGIIIDHCPAGCGVWLDKGELEKIQAFAEYWDKRAVQVMAEKGITLEFDDDNKSSHRSGRGFLGNMLYSLYERFLG